MDFTTLLTPRVIAANYTEASSNRIPYLGESLFPAQKKMGLDLTWIKASKGIPVSLKPSAFDAKATFRELEGINVTETEMPFFREGFKITEKDRQELLRARDSNDPYLLSVLNRIFNYSENLIDAAAIVSERMRMSLLFPENGEMTINFKANGATYSYDYDKTDEWKTNNYAALTSTALWSAPTTADPIKDFIDMADKAADISGTEIKYALMSPKTFNNMVSTDALKSRWLSTAGINAGYITPSEASSVIAQTTGITPVTYGKKYKDESKATKPFVPDGYVTFIPEGNLGSTWYGTTPEEADLMSSSAAEVSIVNTGVAITTVTNPHPVNTEIYASEIVLPSFERMDEVVTLKVL
ncbi:MAG: major capsid protein [Candidatus Cryptobacteroides sp.]